RRGADAEVEQTGEQEARAASDDVERGAGDVVRRQAGEGPGDRGYREDRVGGRVLVDVGVVPGQGCPEAAAVVPAQLPAQVPAVVAPLRVGGFVASSGEALPRRDVAGVARIGDALLVAVAAQHAEGQRRGEAGGDRKLDHAADLHPLEAADGHVAGHAKLVAGV